MQINASLTRLRRLAAFPAIVALLLGFATGAVVALPFTVSQKGRAFQPNEVVVKRGETVLIVNDDADLLHHAYIDSDKFHYDSGDQAPGAKINITFTVPGTFEVLCAIHPKMKLAVRVE